VGIELPLELPPQVIALRLGDQDRGRQMRESYGHPGTAIARERAPLLPEASG
jgi:hypothetical protein